jgi:hypothetical protein
LDHHIDASRFERALRHFGLRSIAKCMYDHKIRITHCLIFTPTRVNGPAGTSPKSLRCLGGLPGFPGMGEDFGSLHDLLRPPGCRGTLGHTEGQHFATAMFQHEKRRHLIVDALKKVHGNHWAEMAVKKYLPILCGRTRETVCSEISMPSIFTPKMDPRRSPQAISSHHSFDPWLSLPCHSWPASTAAMRFRQPCPETCEAARVASAPSKALRELRWLLRQVDEI